MKKGPYKMKGSPHKLGNIEGTEAYKASMAKFTVEQTRASGDATLVSAASELGGSYTPSSQDYSIKTGFTPVGGKGKKKKKKDPPTEEEQTDAYVEKQMAEAHEGKYGKGLFGGYLRRGRAKRRYKKSGHSLED